MRSSKSRAGSTRNGTGSAREDWLRQVPRILILSRFWLTDAGSSRQMAGSTWAMRAQTA